MTISWKYNLWKQRCVLEGKLFGCRDMGLGPWATASQTENLGASPLCLFYACFIGHWIWQIPASYAHITNYGMIKFDKFMKAVYLHTETLNLDRWLLQVKVNIWEFVPHLHVWHSIYYRPLSISFLFPTAMMVQLIQLCYLHIQKTVNQLCRCNQLYWKITLHTAQK